MYKEAPGRLSDDFRVETLKRPEGSGMINSMCWKEKKDANQEYYSRKLSFKMNKKLRLR